MADEVVEVEDIAKVGCLKRIGRSIMGIPIGIMMFFASFCVIWMTEGRTNYADLAATAVIASAEQASGDDGKLVSITGSLDSSETLGDPEFVAPGKFITLSRGVQMYAWKESKSSKTKDKKKETTYSYAKEWTSSPETSSNFKTVTGHENPSMAIQSASHSVKTASIGKWPFDPAAASMPSGAALSVSDLELIGKSHLGKGSGDALYFSPSDLAQTIPVPAPPPPEGAKPSKGNETPPPPPAPKITVDVGNPKVGDLKVAFTGLRAGTSATIFGQAQAGKVVNYAADDVNFFRVFEGSHQTALSTMETEYKVMGWIGRIGGFLLMFTGISMIFAPLHAVADSIPFVGKTLGKFARWAICLVVGPTAFALSLCTSFFGIIWNWIF